MSGDEAKSLGVQVVPLWIIVDGHSHPEPEVDLDRFVEQLMAGAEIRTSQPSPGQFLDAYRSAERAGASSVRSIHIGGSLSGTINSALLAAQEAPIPVEVIDSGTASYPEGLCVRAALDALGMNPEADVRRVVARALQAQDNLFVTLGTERLAAGGRARPVADPLPMLALRRGKIEVSGKVDNLDEACLLLAEETRRFPHGALVAVGEGGLAYWGDALYERLLRQARHVEVARYRVPASVLTRTGPTLGVVVWDRARALERIGDA